MKHLSKHKFLKQIGQMLRLRALALLSHRMTMAEKRLVEMLLSCHSVYPAYALEWVIVGL